MFVSLSGQYEENAKTQSRKKLVKKSKNIFDYCRDVNISV